MKNGFFSQITTLRLPTRYPEDLRKLFAVYSKSRTEEILILTKETQQWIKEL